MPTRRVDLVAGEAVNLTTVAALVTGREYQGQHRGTDGPIYVAELVSVNPTPSDISSAGYVFGVGEAFRLQSLTGSGLWATAPKGGRLTIGEVI